MPLHSRYGVFATPHPAELIEVDGQLGYEINGIFVAICDFRRFTRRAAKREGDILKEFLDATPNLREQAKAGLVTFSIQNGCIHCHTTTEGLKANGPGSANRLRAIDNWMRANLTPERHAEASQRARQQDALSSCRL